LSKYFLLFILIAPGYLLSQEANLAAYYSFDDCTANNSIIGFNGKLIGSPSCVCGYSGMGFKFNGSDLIQLGEDNSGMGDVLTADEFSFATTIHTAKNKPTMCVLSVRADCTANGYEVTYDPGSSRFTFIFNTPSGQESTSFEGDQNSCWQFMAVTRSFNRFLFYVNGKSAGQYLFKTNPNLRSANNPVLGGKSCTGAQNFEGIIDEVRVYSRLIGVDRALILTHPVNNILSDHFQVVFANRPYSVEYFTNCNANFIWNPQMGVSDPSAAKVDISTDQTTRYTVSSTYEGCTQSDTILIKVQDPNTLNCDNMLLPNSFTPNGDNLNDTYGISTVILAEQKCLFEIFDMNGARVFHTIDPEGQWDGTLYGSPAPPGAYLYKIRYTCGDRQYSKAGSVHLIR